jgi:hypothetical protein
MYINECLQVKVFRIISTSYLVTCYEEFFLLWIRPTGETTVNKRILHLHGDEEKYVAQHLCYKYLGRYSVCKKKFAPPSDFVTSRYCWTV